MSDSSNKSTPETDLSARLRTLRNTGSLPSSSTTTPKAAKVRTLDSPAIPPSLNDEPDFDPLRNPFDTDDKTLDELLADLGPEDQWNPDDPADIQKLLDEARTALPDDGSAPTTEKTDEGVTGKKPDKNYITRDLDMSVFALDDEGDSNDVEDSKHAKPQDESREAEDIVARMLDEINIEAASQEKAGAKKDDDSDNDSGDETTLSLPSAPTQLPDLPSGAESSRKSLDFESDIAARMAALQGLGSTNSLGLPSAPTFKPSDKPVKGVMKKIPDEEVDTWCIICQDDATVLCKGCEGDLYCASCWKEGHMGPDVGYEEKMHKWTKYKKPS